jgi:hypothetical protein
VTITVDGGKCCLCHAADLAKDAKRRAKNKNNLVTRSVHEGRARKTLMFTSIPLVAPPGASSTSFLEEGVSDKQWGRLFSWALKHQRHTTDLHGKKGTFRKIYRNAANLRVLDDVARAIGITGTPGTRETPGQRVLRLYSFMTRPAKLKAVLRGVSTSGRVNWDKVRRECGAR